MSLFNRVRLSAVAALALAAAALMGPAPAKAQVLNNADQIVIQLGAVGGQIAGAVANANSSAADAMATAAGVNLVNTSSVDVALDTVSRHIGAAGAVSNDVGTIVGQGGVVGGQAAGAIANALAKTTATADATAANIVNSSNVGINVKVNTSRH